MRFNAREIQIQKSNNFSCRYLMSRMLETHEMIVGIILLLSPAASHINGQNIVVNGGKTCW